MSFGIGSSYVDILYVSMWDSPRYWLPLIAMYTGARQSEIYHLTLSDIKKVDGVYVFDFVDHPEDGVYLKTKHSRRKIPIHSMILKAGFLDYVKSREAEGQTKLFNQFTQRNYSKQFGNLLKRLEIKHDKNTFHSFRHSVTDALRKENVSERIAHFVLIIVCQYRF